MKYLLWTKRWVVGKESYRYNVLQYGPLENFKMCYNMSPIENKMKKTVNHHAPHPHVFSSFPSSQFPHICALFSFPYLPTCMTVSFHNNLTWGGGGGV